MRSVTGVELGPDSCLLVHVRPSRRGTARVSAADGVRTDESGGDGPLQELLREIRTERKYPRRARVVVWGERASAFGGEEATRDALRPLLDAGFRVDRVVSPPEALAALARSRRRAAGVQAAAWLAVNRHGAAIAIVHAGELLFSRELEWNYRAGATLREELLQRYSLVAHLAPELRHGFDVVRAERGILVDVIVTCGNLPDLRSLTMPLIEELDVEVETLDSLDGLELRLPPGTQELTEAAPALRLACAAATAKAVPRRRRAAVRQVAALWKPAAAALVLVLALLWGAMRLASVGDTAGEPAAQAVRTAPGTGAARESTSAPPAPDADAPGSAAQAPVESQTTAPDVNRPAATTGTSALSAGPSRTAEPPSPAGRADLRAGALRPPDDGPLVVPKVAPARPEPSAPTEARPTARTGPRTGAAANAGDAAATRQAPPRLGYTTEITGGSAAKPGVRAESRAGAGHVVGRQTEETSNPAADPRRGPERHGGEAVGNKPQVGQKAQRPAPPEANRSPAVAKRGPTPLREPLPVVNSILVSPDRRLAVVDGAIVREGDEVGPRVLIRIERDALVFREPSGYEVRVPIRRRTGGAAERQAGL